MKFVFIICLIAYSLFGSIEKYKINFKKDKANIVLFFDKPFAIKDIVSNIDKKNTNTIIINDSFSFKNKQDVFKDSFLRQIKFVDIDNKTYVLLSSDKKLSSSVQSSSDNMQLYINLSVQKILPFIDSSSKNKIHLKEESIGYKDYFLSFFIVAIILIAYWYFRVKVLKLPNNINAIGYKVIFQKSLDIKVKISLIEVYDKKYLILSGVGHSLLLDTIIDKDISKQEFKDMVDGVVSKNIKTN